MACTGTSRRTPSAPALAAVLLLLAAVTARADRVTLYDGTVLDGTVIRQGDNYWVKTPDGKRKVIPVADVKSLQKGSVPPALKAAAPSSPEPHDAAPAATAGARLDYASTERKASSVDAPLAAVTLWQAFIDSKPNKDELAAAQAE